MVVHVVDQDEHTSVVQVRGPGQVELFVRTTGRLAPDQSMWVPLLLPVAMRHGVDLHVHGTLDEGGLVGVGRAQTLLASWWPKLHQVAVTADEATTWTPGEGVGLAFSAGVDAFHSLHRHLKDVTHLWFVHGFDVPLWRTHLREQISRHLGAVADATGKQLVEVVTNVKPCADRHVRWGEIYHGPATAGIGIGHATWGRALIASSHVEADLHPWGSHPDLDPAWSSTAVRVEHDAVEVDRVEKVDEIGSWDTAMRHLRVCWENPDQEYNCGNCGKCVRTKINLIAAGATSPALPGPVDPVMVGPAHPGETAYHARTNLRHLRGRGLRPDLADALESALADGPGDLRRLKVRKAAKAVLRRGRM